MNERIKEIERWSFKEIPVGLNGKSVAMEFDRQKFAETIIKECIAQIEVERGNPYRNMGDENRYGIGACDESIRRIKEHFGVE